MSPTLLVLLLAAPPQATLLVVDGWAVASVDGGRWSAPSRSTVCAGRELRLYAMREAGAASSAPRVVRCAVEDEQFPELVLLEPKPSAPVLEWSGTRTPTAARATIVPLGSSVYRAVVQRHVGAARRRAHLHDVRRVDLDGDGTEEVVLIASSRARGDQGASHPQDWSLVAVHFIDGKGVRTRDLVRHDRTGEQLGPSEQVLHGLVDVDGDGTVELVIEDRDPWGQSLEVWRFRAGKLERLSQVGMGE